MPGNSTPFWHRARDLPQDVCVRAWSLIAEHFDLIIDDFYVQIGNSGAREHLNGLDIAGLKAKQKAHWAALFTRGTDGDYAERLHRMYARHHQIGLDSETYLMAYMFLLTRFHRAILAGASGPAEAYHLIQIANTIVAGDIHRAMAIYFAPHTEMIIALD